jgi:hypothetical protein
VHSQTLLDTLYKKGRLTYKDICSVGFSSAMRPQKQTSEENTHLVAEDVAAAADAVDDANLRKMNDMNDGDESVEFGESRERWRRSL